MTYYCSCRVGLTGAVCQEREFRTGIQDLIVKILSSLMGYRNNRCSVCHQTSNNQVFWFLFCFQLLFKLGKLDFLSAKSGKRLGQGPNSLAKLHYLAGMTRTHLGLRERFTNLMPCLDSRCTLNTCTQIRRPEHLQLTCGLWVW